MFRLLIFIVILLFPLISFGSSVCSKEDKDYAKFWDDYYSPEEAFEFGKKIQKLFEDKNIVGLFDLVDGELQYGPRRAYALNRKFDEIFDKDFVNAVLKDPPSCSPVGWRGFMLGRGEVWFNKIDGQWEIFSIHGNQEQNNLKKVGWKIDDIVLHPKCFTRVWMSGDNFEEFADYFKISDYEDFSNNPGKYYYTKINDFNPIKPSWCSNHNCEKISIVNAINKCTPNNFVFEEDEGSILINEDGIQYIYKVVKDVKIEKCNKLSKNFKTKCIEAFLVKVGDYSGGSMGWDISYGIYGLYNIDGLGKSVVPLKYFSSKNKALNFFD